jgi:two-component sensor histidine kinase
MPRWMDEDGIERAGMGLATARRLVERLGEGDRRRGSAGRGARFSFTVPERPVLVDTGQAEGTETLGEP